MLYPTELFEEIILYVNNPYLVPYFKNILSKKTITTLLQNLYIEKEIIADNFAIVNLMLEYEMDVSWLAVSVHEISENMIRAYSDKLVWLYISEKQMSDDFIDEFVHLLDWNKVSKYQKLSKNIICKYADLLNWQYVCEFQILDEFLIDKFVHKIHWGALARNQNIILPKKYYNLLDQSIF
jgi:hypothetical protein